MMKRGIKTFFKDPDPVEGFDEVERGLNVVDGIACIEEPLLSPLRGMQCVGFFYQSFAVTRGGQQPAPPHRLKQAEVYTRFELQMEGGTLRVEPVKPGAFSREEHQTLAEQYGKTFHAQEDVILPGARVRLRGKVVERDGAMVLRMKTLTVLEAQAVAVGVMGNRSQKRKGKARRKRKKK